MLPLAQNQKWTTFDAVKGLLAMLPEDRIPTRTPLLHQALYRLVQNTNFKKFLNDYVFDNRSYFPFARDFDTDLTNLEMSGHLSANNPGFTDYTIQPKLHKTFEKYTKDLFSPEELETLKKMADVFFEELEKLQAQT